MAGTETLKLLTPGTVNLQPLPSGGRPEITPQLVAAALSKMPKHISSYARVKYTMSREEQSCALQWRKWNQPIGIFEILREMVELRPDADSWPVGKQKRLIELAVVSDVMPNVCTVCQGTKERNVDSHVIQCEACDGTGRKRMTQDVCAAYLGMDRRAYARLWQSRHTWLIRILSDWDRVVYKTVSGNL